MSRASDEYCAPYELIGDVEHALIRFTQAVDTLRLFVVPELNRPAIVNTIFRNPCYTKRAARCTMMTSANSPDRMRSRMCCITSSFKMLPST
jgi:hypothetical protein